jgi:hypothetical protein
MRPDYRFPDDQRVLLERLDRLIALLEKLLDEKKLKK